MMIQFLKAVRDDLRDAIRYYEAQRPGLGAEFLDEDPLDVGADRTYSPGAAPARTPGDAVPTASPMTSSIK